MSDPVPVRVIAPGVSGADLAPHAKRFNPFHGGKNVPKKVRCSNCGEPGHNIKTCPKPTGKAPAMRAKPAPGGTVSVSPDEIMIRIRVIVSVEQAK